MQSTFWLERWQQNQIGFHQTEINAHLQEYWPGLGIPETGRVLVPLCGKSSDMLWLRAQGHGVLGIELSPIAVEEFFTENNLDPVVTQKGEFQRWEADGLVLLCGDFFQLKADDLINCSGVFDRASLIALPPDMRSDYARQMVSIMPKEVRMLLVTMEYVQEEMQGPPFSVHEAEVRQLYQENYEVSVLFKKDIIAENPRFDERGISQLVEKVYQLTPLQGHKD
jgi:thiopurine S-methyltransferase